MSKFGIIGEGITDQITIENILCGFFENPDLENEIQYLQPPKHNTGIGGWKVVFKYLVSSDFRNDILNNEFVILQIDTDVSNEVGYDVQKKYNQNNELLIPELINNVTERLISEINQGELGFYEQYADKIIFAISVHSLECWLVAYYGEHIIKDNCFDVLRTTKLPKNIQLSKTHSKYDMLSQAFLNRENIEIVRIKDTSFKHFIQQLQPISP